MVPGRLHAPQQDGAVVAEPPLAEAGRLLLANRQRLAQGTYSLLGRSLTYLRQQARQAALTAARDYFHHNGEPSPKVDHSSLVLAGHQPDLSHAGVWVKNYALNQIARLHEATPVNLIVDNDTAKATVMRLPSRDGQIVTIPFDRWKGDIPYEEREVADEALFAHLCDQTGPVTADWGFAPILPIFWAEVLRQAEHTRLLGERLVRARRTFERLWGCHNLEVPVSRLCQTEPFAWFFCHILAKLARFHEIYNGCLHDYRRCYRVRSRNHPVPELVVEDGWLEMPFWAWRADQPKRRRLLARAGRATVDLRIGNEPGPSLPLPTAANAVRAVAAFQDLKQQGFKVRCRALTNTLYARLFLADLFVHGIGGGKYDELTDEIIRRFYGFEPPEYLVLSATLLLPFPLHPVSAEGHARLARQLRDLHWNPQRHFDDGIPADPIVQHLTAQKDVWVARQPTDASERRERFHMLRSLTEQLRSSVAEREHGLRQELARNEQQLQANAVLTQRDYAFCLFPEAKLQAFCTSFLSLPVARPSGTA